jgi:hypothetical protein
MMQVTYFRFYVVSEGDRSVGIEPFNEEITMTSTYNDKGFNKMFEEDCKDFLENVFDNGTIVKVFNEQEYLESLEHYHNRMKFESFITDLARQKDLNALLKD